MTIVPNIEDHNKTITCNAMQQDGENMALYGIIQAQNVTLNVTFPPQPMANQTVKVKEGHNASVSFVFQVCLNQTVIKIQRFNDLNDFPQVKIPYLIIFILWKIIFFSFSSKFI